VSTITNAEGATKSGIAISWRAAGLIVAIGLVCEMLLGPIGT